MKRFKKLLPIAVTLALVAALAVPMAALADVTSATVTVSPAVKSTADADYTIVFDVGGAGALAADDTITIVFPSDTAVVNATTITGTVNGTAIEANEGSGVSATRTATIIIPTGVTVANSGTVTLVLDSGITNPTIAGTYTLTAATSIEASAITSGNYNITETGDTVVSGEVPAVIEVTAPDAFTMPSLDPSASPISSGSKTIQVDANGTQAWTLQAHEASGDGKMEDGSSNILASEIELDVSGASENDVVMSGTAQAIDTHAAASATLGVIFKQAVAYADTVSSTYTITITFTVGYDA